MSGAVVPMKCTIAVEPVQPYENAPMTVSWNITCACPKEGIVCRLRFGKIGATLEGASPTNSTVIEHAITLGPGSMGEWVGEGPPMGLYQFSIIASGYIVGHSEITDVLVAPTKEWKNKRLSVADKLRRHSSSHPMPLTLVGAVTEDDFEIMGLIGQGSHAQVMLVRTKVPPVKTHAMKVLKKKLVVDRGQLEHAMEERNVLEKFTAHPFIVNLHYAFQTEDKLFFILDLCPGGELFLHLKNEGTFNQRRAMFYTAEIASALDYIHSMGVIHHDVQPENLLIDEAGHIKLSDFGLCKRMEVVVKDEPTKQAPLGTPEYIAPETLLMQKSEVGAGPLLMRMPSFTGSAKKATGKEVDWWALGTLLYEMLSGLPPFYDKKINIMYRRILNDPLPEHEKVSQHAFALIEKLLVREPTLRLGHGRDDFVKVKAEKFFSTIDWKRLNSRDYLPDFVPDENSVDEMQHVDPALAGLPSDMSPSPNVDGSKFSGFTFSGKRESLPTA